MDEPIAICDLAGGGAGGAGDEPGIDFGFPYGSDDDRGIAAFVGTTRVWHFYPGGVGSGVCGFGDGAGVDVAGGDFGSDDHRPDGPQVVEVAVFAANGAVVMVGVFRGIGSHGSGGGGGSGGSGGSGDFSSTDPDFAGGEF